MKICFATPASSSDVKFWFYKSSMQTVWPPNSTRIDLFSLGMGRVKAENSYAAIMLELNADFLVIASVDAAWSPHTISALIAHNKPIIAAPSRNRFHPFHCHVCDSFDPLTNTLHTVQDPEARKGLEQVVACGGELSVFRRDLFLTMPPPWFCDSFVHPSAPKTAPPLSQDYNLCIQAATFGIPTFTDWDFWASHYADGLVTGRHGVMSYV